MKLRELAAIDSDSEVTGFAVKSDQIRQVKTRRGMVEGGEVLAQVGDLGRCELRLGKLG